MGTHRRKLNGEAMKIRKEDLGEPIWVCRDCLSLFTTWDNQDKCFCGGDDWFKYIPAQMELFEDDDEMDES